MESPGLDSQNQSCPACWYGCQSRGKSQQMGWPVDHRFPLRRFTDWLGTLSIPL